MITLHGVVLMRNLLSRSRLWFWEYKLPISFDMCKFTPPWLS